MCIYIWIYLFLFIKTYLISESYLQCFILADIYSFMQFFAAAT